MKPQQFVKLLICIIAGLLWMFIFQSSILLDVFDEFLVGEGVDIQAYVEQASSPAFWALWLSCIAGVLIWLWVTTKDSPMNSKQVRAKRPYWWFGAGGLVLLGWGYQLVWIYKFRDENPVEGLGANYFPVTPVGLAILLLLVILDVCLMFWLPTVLASPKSYRLVVPGALKIVGGR